MRVFLSIALALGWNAFAQTQRLVSLDVAAIDAQGGAVTDLQAADVQVREDGKPMPIVFFRFAGDHRLAIPPAPGEFTNRPMPAPMLILFDRWNERIMTAASGWNDIDNALRHKESADRVYIFFLTSHGELFPVHPMPFGEQGTGSDEISPAGLVTKLDQAVHKLQGLRDVDAIDPIARTNTTFQALAGLLQQMAWISGRKSLIWITHGVPLTAPALTGDWVDFAPPIRRLSELAADSRTAIYTVAQSAEGAGADVSSLSRQALEMFAELTGGRFYPSGNSDTAISAAASDARAIYRIAYYSTVRDKDNKEHKIRITSTRKGIKLQSRQGYVPGAALAISADEKEQAAFGNEAAGPFDATDIALRVTMSRKSRSVLHLDMRVDPVDVLIQRQGDRYRGGLALAPALYVGTELQQPPPPVNFDIDLTPDQFAAAAKSWIHVGQDVTVDDKTQKVRMMVYDRELHSLGSVTIPIQ